MAPIRFEPSSQGLPRNPSRFDITPLFILPCDLSQVLQAIVTAWIEYWTTAADYSFTANGGLTGQAQRAMFASSCRRVPMLRLERVRPELYRAWPTAPRNGRFAMRVPAVRAAIPGIPREIGGVAVVSVGSLLRT